MKKYLYISITLILAIVAISIAVPKAKANPLYFPVTSQTSPASSTVNFLSPGLGTTTLPVDAYSSGTPTGILNGTLLIQFAGTSSPAALLRVAVQYAQGTPSAPNCTLVQTACDWYEDGGVQAFNYATTSKPFDISQVNYFQFTYLSASSTGLSQGSSAPLVGSGSSGTYATSTRAVKVNLPTRYARFVFSIPPSGGNGALWAQFVPQKEQPTNN